MAKLRYRLCPSSLKETEFWRVYYVLLHNIKKRSDTTSELPITPSPTAFKSANYTSATAKKALSPSNGDERSAMTVNGNGRQAPPPPPPVLTTKQKIKAKLATIGSPKDVYDPHAKPSPEHKPLTNGKGGVLPKAAVIKKIGSPAPIKTKDLGKEKSKKELEKERLEKAEKERLEKERAEKERVEKERIEKEWKEVDFDEIDRICGLDNVDDIECEPGLDEMDDGVESDTDSCTEEPVEYHFKKTEIEPSHPVPKSELTPPQRPLQPLNTDVVNDLPPLLPAEPEPFSPLTPWPEEAEDANFEPSYSSRYHPERRHLQYEDSHVSELP